MLVIWLTACFLLSFEIGQSSSACPCSDPSLCNPVRETIPRKEVVGFAYGSSGSRSEQYDWNKLTTIVLAQITAATDEIVCLAHKNNVKVQYLVAFRTDELLTPGFRDKFINETIGIVQRYHLDGVNMDYEDAVTEPAKGALDTLMIQLRRDLKRANPLYGLSMDYVFCATCSPRRTFNIGTLKHHIDFFILMDYSMQGFALFNSMKGHCWEVFNSPLPAIIWGMESFLHAGIPQSQLVLAFPWYGNYYKCESLDKRTNRCYVDCDSIWKVPHTRVYSQIMTLMRSGPYQRMWNSEVSMPFFNYKAEDGSTYQMNYDDPVSLGMKYDVAKKYGLRGVGIWNIDQLDYHSQNESVIKDKTEMWKALPGGQ